jgi:hypothetical protein
MYNVSRNGAEIGKYPKEEITDGLMTRFFLPTDHCWKPGMTEWKLLIVEFAAPADPTLPPPPPAPPVRRPDAAGIPTPSTSYQPVAQPQAPQKLSEWGKAWLLGGFLMPYIFAWRIIFDRTYGFTRTTKIIYSVWTACFFLSIINASTRGDFASNTSSRRTESLESKNAAFMARHTPEQREAVEYSQRGFRLALRNNFEHQDSNKDGRLDMKEFLSQGLFKNTYGEADFDRKDINKDGYITFEEAQMP